MKLLSRYSSYLSGLLMFSGMIWIVKIETIHSVTPVQDSTITLKLPYLIIVVCQNIDVGDVLGQIPKSIYQALYLLLSDFLNNFSKLVLI